MDSDILNVALVAVGLACWLTTSVAPSVLPGWYARTLHGWGARRAVLVEFALDPGRRLREGAEVELALGRLYVRQVTTVYIGMACIGLSYLLLFHGPHLSESTATSLAVSGLPLLASLVAVAQLRGFADPYRTEGGRARPAGVEDYVWPVTRALAWVLAAAAMLVPVGAAVLAAGPSYDAGRVWWEGLTASPLSAVALVVAVEVWLHRTADAADPGDPTLYVWDCFRTRAVQLLYGFAFIDLGMSFDWALGGLNGVALTDAGPAWLESASSACVVLKLASFGALLLLLVQPVAPRLRARLWPGVPPMERIEFGRALPIR